MVVFILLLKDLIMSEKKEVLLTLDWLFGKDIATIDKGKWKSLSDVDQLILHLKSLSSILGIIVEDPTEGFLN